MARIKKSQATGPQGSWLDTYADMITLLLTFFVLLFSTSLTDDSKWKIIQQAFESWGGNVRIVVGDTPSGELDVDVIGALPNDPTTPTGNGGLGNGAGGTEEVDLEAGELPVTFNQLYQYLQNYVESNDLGGSVAVEKGDTYAYLRFQDKIFFGGDSSTLLPEGKTLLEGISPGLQSVEHLMLGIKVFGHTADFRDSPVDEWDLSADRANSVRRYMVQLGIADNSKYTVTGFGKNRPIAPNDTEEGRTMNRRVEIIILRNDVDLSNPDVIRELAKLDYSLEIFDPEQQEENGENWEETSVETAAPSAS